jgi:transposase
LEQASRIFDAGEVARGVPSGEAKTTRSPGGLTKRTMGKSAGDMPPVTFEAMGSQSASTKADTLGEGSIALDDCAYDGAPCDIGLPRGACANVKPMPRRVNVPAFSRFLHRFRNHVERFFNRLKHFRAIATRFEKHDANNPLPSSDLPPPEFG